MCDQRERLIGYVYGEGDERDLAEVQKHVDACADCRAEVAGLRSTRTDLLAWDVPAHQSVWRPFVAAPVTPWWRQVPAWAMAAAAGFVLLTGAAGGAVVHAFMPDQTVTRQSDVAVNTGAPALTAADLASVEQRVLARMRDQVGAVDARVQKVSTRSESVQLLESDHNALMQELVRLKEENTGLVDVIKSINVNLDQIRSAHDFKNAALDNKIENLKTLVVSQLQLSGR